MYDSLQCSLYYPGFDFDELLDLGKERGLSNMELKLRTTLMPKIAGQSRTVVSSVVQTTKLALSFFIQNGHKSLEELHAEVKPFPTRSLRPQKSGEELSKKELAEYERLRSFIFSKVFHDNGLADKSIRTQSCIDALIAADLSVAKLRSNYNRHGGSGRTFYVEMCSAMEKIYDRVGPQKFNFKNFVSAIVEFLKRTEEATGSKQGLPAAAAAANALELDEAEEAGAPAPAWYRCRICGLTRAHWFYQCPNFANSKSVNDEKYIANFIGTYPNLIATTTNLLSQFRPYLEDHFIASCSLESKRTFCLLTVEALIKGMAALNMSDRLLLQCRGLHEDIANQRLYNKFKNAASAFPSYLNLDAVKQIIKDYVASS